MGEPPPDRRRLYQVWKGSNKFLFGGRLIFGPDAGSLFLSTVLIASPLAGLCFQCVTKLSSSGGSSPLGLPVLLATILLGLSDLAFLFLTSSRDPGIVPRNARPPEQQERGGVDDPVVADDDDIVSASTEWVAMSAANNPHLRLPRNRDVVVAGGHVVRVKYCDTCLLYRPPRASHCSICNNCVRKFDHHCPWVGQCIGLRNYRFFFLFISTSTFLCLYVFVLSWLNIAAQRASHGGSLLRSVTGEPLSLVLIVYSFVVAWFVGGLTVFHIYLMSTNQTTYENFRYRYEEKENPYNRGVLANMSEVFCTGMPPSMNNFRAWMELPAPAPEAFDAGPPLASRDKIDLEMGHKGGVQHHTGVPPILQGLHYAQMEKNYSASVHIKDRRSAEAPDPFMIPEAPRHAAAGEAWPPAVFHDDGV
uniref:S-acyltransferase n=2 Tax=Zea mays TaxID=4577 RepID=A0A804N274_MAIZE